MNALWLALHFHRFPLEVFDPYADSAAVVAEQHRVLSASATAEARGIAAGMRLSGALGLAPELVVHEREPTRETDALYRLACWAGSFSPHVSLQAPNMLLLEIGGCLRLFNGLGALWRLIRDGASTQGFSLHMGIAPTPMAAQWIARAGQRGCLRTEDLRKSLDALPISVIDASLKAQKTFAALGVTHLRDLFALPRAGLARRFGTALPLQLAQALGEVPDLRQPFVFPELFVQKLELPAKVELADMLLFAARRLLSSLAGWLAARASGVAACTLLLEHEEIADTRLVLSFASPTRDLERMERVLRERLAQHALAAPVTYLHLEASDAVVLAGHTLGLFAQASAQPLEPVIERLRARLGQGAVHAIAVRADHRPECATLQQTNAKSDAKDDAPSTDKPRPFWLLRRPQALKESSAGVLYGGVLQRMAGPERIESGWWDDAPPEDAADTSTDVRRDYYIALSQAGEWLWIFRDRAGWWLHGVFS